MKVAIFTDTYLPDVNGVARTLGRWVQYLQKQGSTCRVFAPQCEPDAGPADFGSEMVKRFYSIPFLLYPECKLAIPNPMKIKRSLQEFQPDLIHLATPFNLGLYGLHYAKKHHIPVVASYHTHFDQYLQYYKIHWVENTLWRYLGWFYQTCRKLYVPSRSTLDYLARRGFARMEVWGRGVDTSFFQPQVNRSMVLQSFGIDPAKFVILFVGRLAPEKSVDVLLAMFEALPARIREHAVLIAAGEGPLYKELSDVYTGNEQVVFPGFVRGQRLAELYAAADVFVFPSATETFGNVVLEAMAAGTPVIGADAGGVRDTVSHLQNGWLCPAGEAEAFSAAVASLYDHETERKRLGEAGRAFSLVQSWDRIFDGLLESYRDIVPEAPRELSNQDWAEAR